jgi:hypothetical protein
MADEDKTTEPSKPSMEQLVSEFSEELSSLLKKYRALPAAFVIGCLDLARDEVKDVWQRRFHSIFSPTIGGVWNSWVAQHQEKKGEEPNDK